MHFFSLAFLIAFMIRRCPRISNDFLRITSYWTKPYLSIYLWDIWIFQNFIDILSFLEPRHNFYDSSWWWQLVFAFYNMWSSWMGCSGINKNCKNSEISNTNVCIICIFVLTVRKYLLWQLMLPHQLEAFNHSYRKPCTNIQPQNMYIKLQPP